MTYNWNWRIFWELSPDGVHTYWDTLASGLLWTLATSLAGWAMALILGMLIGTLRTLPGVWVRRLGTA
jgi:glutamate/aspartate transport system permease protein